MAQVRGRLRPRRYRGPYSEWCRPTVPRAIQHARYGEGLLLAVRYRSETTVEMRLAFYWGGPCQIVARLPLTEMRFLDSHGMAMAAHAAQAAQAAAEG